MDKAASAPERAENPSAEMEIPSGWAEAQESLAASAGLAVLLVAGAQPPSLQTSHNNSICRAFQTSEKYAHLCDPFCGRAYERAMEASEVTYYRCHAGLNCFAMPVEIGTARSLAVIGGRAFVRSADYRALAERLRKGDLEDLLSPELFSNVIFALETDLDDLALRLRQAAEELNASFKKTIARDASSKAEAGRRKESTEVAPEKSPASLSSAKNIEAAKSEALKDKTNGVSPNVSETPQAPLMNAGQTKLFGSAASLSEACERFLKSLSEAQSIESLALMLRADEGFNPVFSTGDFKTKPPRVALKAKEIKLLQGATHGESIAVPAGGRTATRHEDAIELFPLSVGGEIKGALLVGDKKLSDEKRRAIGAFCREIAMPLEVLRLREELERRMHTATHLRAFVERINSVPPGEAFQMILRHSADLLKAERGSLLLFDETANELSVKAAVGPRADAARDARVRLGEGVSGAVLSGGRPVVVADLSRGGWKPAPAERSYKTKSFISYPLIVSGRKVGVLNVTDKAGGGNYDEIDLSLLDMIAPQMALALDRAQWHEKATQFQLLSITDPLTGLLNRRYLEERLSEELERSRRHQFQMSFMMVDIDDFKLYNDLNGHQAGDLALEMTAQCLKSALRSEDVASRYGGEEFCILLPQTGLIEANIIGERIRKRIERTQFPQGKKQPLGSITVSIGISALGPGLDTSASIIYAADQALYLAKSRGKNRVNVFEAETTENTKDGDAQGE